MSGSPWFTNHLYISDLTIILHIFPFVPSNCTKRSWTETARVCVAPPLSEPLKADGSALTRPPAGPLRFAASVSSDARLSGSNPRSEPEKLTEETLWSRITGGCGHLSLHPSPYPLLCSPQGPRRPESAAGQREELITLGQQSEAHKLQHGTSRERKRATSLSFTGELRSACEQRES